MVKLSINVLKSSRTLDGDVKMAVCQGMTNEMQSKILGGQTKEKDLSPICDAVCYPSEMGHCSCYHNLC
ncbi:hypothetical protein Premu_0725 [Hallella multisaccharivorax DSM 17128]|mgnify:CR=1 FL=1|uniref:Uncharacterized protein n=1 Tax=Hallella multisaccharivorax DSM 17128 TaxID=688246 RepID=F8N6A8_9BACT|nr:hypothetical protein Premu_0725 [Hallella multisaccharivorax DSM 17128]